jgi:hypothetical protein
VLCASAEHKGKSLLRVYDRSIIIQIRNSSWRLYAYPAQHGFGSTVNTRNVVFISHANPEDNPFTIWLGAKLAGAGYEVWADVLRLRGGQDWQRRLEDAIRNRACKVLLVANEVSVNKQGVRNEIQIASDTARKISDSDFIIPLRLGPYNAPFLVAQSQYIDFERGWASGLAELLQVLQDTYKVPRLVGNTDAWLHVQLIHGKGLTTATERLVSTWLEVRRLPAYVYYYPDLEAAPKNYPKVEYRDGVLTFANQDVPGRRSRRSAIFLKYGWPDLELTIEDARRRFADILNQALEDVFKAKRLKSHEMGTRQLAWWVTADSPQGRISFKWPECVGSRQIQGASLKRNIRWHFGVSASFRSVPLHHFRLKSRLIFTQDGFAPLESTARAHRLRRSFAKGWRNARWRDMFLSFLYWLGDGTTVLDVPVAAGDALVLSLPSIIFSCPVGVEDDDDKSQDEDDPDVEFLTDEELEDEPTEQS